MFHHCARTSLARQAAAAAATAAAAAAAAATAPAAASVSRCASVAAASLRVSRHLRWSSSTAAAATAKPLQILFGSQTGTARGFAEELASHARDKSVNCEVVDLSKFDPTSLKSGTNTALLMACYGMGEPTDNARAFYQWLMDPGRSADALKGVRFSVFGLGSKTTHCDRFCVVGINVDKRMEELGAQRMLERVDGDDSDCIELQFDEWQAKLLDTVSKSPSTTTTATTTCAPASSSSTSSAADAKAFVAPAAKSCALPGISVTRSSASEAAAAAAKAGPLPPMYEFMKSSTYYSPRTACLPVLSNTELTPNATRSLKELRLSLRPIVPSASEETQVYQSGDHLVVYPTIPADDVTRLLQRLDLTTAGGDADSPVFIKYRTQGLSSAVIPNTTPITLRQAMSHIVDIRAIPSLKMLRTLADLCTDANDKRNLIMFTERDTYKAQVTESGRVLGDLLQEFPSIRLSVEQCLEMLPRIHPRFYSISSSPMVTPDELSITYRLLDYNTRHNNLKRFGVCSKFLYDRTPFSASTDRTTNGWLPSHVWKSEFKLPAKEKGVVMIAGGTGIAPFHGFLTELSFLRKRNPHAQWGPVTLYYGIRDDNEFAYKDQIQQAVKDNIITRCRVSFSAPAEGPAIMLTDDIASDAAHVYQQIKEGASVYVCGGVNGFGPSIVSTFKTRIFEQAGKMSKAEADAAFKNLMASGRYLEDLG